MENDGGNKRIKEMSIDRLSALPDGILLHILSFLDYDLKQNEAAITCLLSKRWQFLWSELPKLYFFDYMCNFSETRDFVSWVHRAIILRSGSFKLEEFGVNFDYKDCFASDVNAWVHFAVKNKVKTLSLRLRSQRYFYTLPQVLCSPQHSSLTSLYLRRCIVAPHLKIEWPCLSVLAVKDVELHDDVIQKILSGCPVLYSLELSSCWGFKRLDVVSKALHELFVYDSVDKNKFDILEISAPYLRTLYVSFSPVQKKLQLINVQSLDAADFCFNECDESVEVMKNTVEILDKVQHAEELVLGGLFVEVVSMLALNGLRIPQSKRKNLVIDALRDSKSISGILALIEASPNIDTLLIECTDSFQKTDMAWVPAEKNDLDCDLLNLKTVRLIDFADPNLDGEPMLTIARILLKRATSLEMMRIKAHGSFTEFASEFTKMSETVLGYPRSSEKALVVHRVI